MRHGDSLLLFARAPAAGRVKTRLLEVLSAEEALALHVAMVHDAADLVRRYGAAHGSTGALCWSEPCDGLADAARGLEVMVQEGDDLGERLVRAFQARFHAGDRRVVVIGSDSPTLTSDALEAAFQALEESEVAIAPAEDGGFVLLGCSRMHVRPFQRIPWGTGRVLAETRRRLRKEKIPHTVLRTGHDLDTWEDLLRIHEELEHLESVGAREIARRTLACLRELVGGNAQGT